MIEHHQAKILFINLFKELPKMNKIFVEIICFYDNEEYSVDPDNLFIKPIFDALKVSKKIPDDNFKFIDGVCLRVKIDKENPRTEILITEIE